MPTRSFPVGVSSDFATGESGMGTKIARARAASLLAARVELHQTVKELLALVHRAHAYALVQPVHARAVGVAEHAGDAVRRDPRVDREPAVGGAGKQRRHDGHAGPHL